jgi:hypothetical protein
MACAFWWADGTISSDLAPSPLPRSPMMVCYGMPGVIGMVLMAVTIDQCRASSGDGVAAFGGFFRPHSARPWTKT